MSSANVLKQISLDLVNYFGIQRKETSFDLSGPNFPLRHYPTRFQRTLIDYRQDSSKPVKHYFSSQDLRKRLTCFASETLDNDRNAAIINKLKDYIKTITKKNYNQNVYDLGRIPPWDPFWWKSRGQTFRTMYLMSKYGGRKCESQAVNRFSSSYRPARKYRSLRSGDKLRPIYGDPPVLRMCPDPYITKGEAERIINQVAKLLLITEGYEPLAYEYTATGGKIRQLILNENVLSQKLNEESESYKNAQKIKNQLKTAPTIQEAISTSTEESRLRTGTFKIKKLTSKDVISEIVSSTSLNAMNTEYENSTVSVRNDLLLSENKICTKSFSNDNLLEPTKSRKPIYVGCCSRIPKKSKISNEESAKEVTKKVSKEISESSINIVSQKLSTDSIETEPQSDVRPTNLIPQPTKSSTVGTWLMSQHSNEDDSYEIQKNQNYNSQNFEILNKIANSQNEYTSTSHRFEIKVVTSDRVGASTNAVIWLNIFGDINNLRKSVKLKKSLSNRQPFLRGNTDIFKLESSIFLGKIKSIQIGHYSDKPGSDWYLESVSIKDCDYQLNYFFPCWRWLSVRADDKQCQIKLECNPAIYEPLNPFQISKQVEQESFQCSKWKSSNNDMGTEHDDIKSMKISADDINVGFQNSDMIEGFSGLTTRDLVGNNSLFIRSNRMDGCYISTNKNNITSEIIELNIIPTEFSDEYSANENLPNLENVSSNNSSNTSSTDQDSLNRNVISWDCEIVINDEEV